MVLHYFVRPLLGFIYISSYYLSVMTLVFQQGYFVVCVLVLINVVTLVLFFFSKLVYASSPIIICGMLVLFIIHDC
jgi:hypothetical protein